MINEQIFFALNPWQTGKWNIDKNLISRSIRDIFIKRINDGFIQVLIGARRTGKTTLMMQSIDYLLHQQKIPSNNIFYFNFDDIELRSELKNDPHLPIKIIELFSGITIAENQSSLYLFIDEAQKYPEYFSQIKLYYDAYGSKIKFILSGSAALEIGSHTAETFVGRAQHNYLFPFSLKEIIEHYFPGIKLPSLIGQLIAGNFREQRFRSIQSELLVIHQKIAFLLNQILFTGLLPEPFLAKTPELAFEYLKQYRLTYMERDIRSLAQVGNLEDFSRLLNLLILQIGNLLVKSRFASDVGIAQNTVVKYLSILEQTFVLEQLRPYAYQTRKRLVKAPKIYLFDVGFFSQVAGMLEFKVLEASGKLGAVYENLCFNEFRKSIVNNQEQAKIYFWRTTGGAEVDFVIESGEQLIPVEVKFSRSYSRSDLKNLLRFKQDHPKRVKKMIFVYNGFFKKEGDFIFVPLWLV